MTIIIQRVFIPENETSNAINAAAQKSITQKEMAEFYADCIRAGECDWPRINRAIMERWPKGLQRIKAMAWKCVETERAGGPNG